MPPGQTLKTIERNNDIIRQIKQLDYKNLTWKQIAEKLNISFHVLKTILANSDIVKSEPGVPIRKKLIKNTEYIVNELDNGKKMKILAKEFNCDYSRIADFLKSINYEYSKRNLETFTDDDLERICKLYYSDDQSLVEVGKQFNCSCHKISRFLLKNGYKIKDTLAELVKRSQTDALQRKCFEGSMRYKLYTLPDGTQIKLRGYEPNFLDHVFNNNLLRQTDIDYKPERIAFKFNEKKFHYYPDFFITPLNLIVEIKSRYILEKQGLEKTKCKQLFTEKEYKYIMILDNDFTEFDQYINNIIPLPINKNYE